MKIAYDVTLCRPGCVLLQAALGGDVPRHRFHELFATKTWLIAPTPNLHLYEVTEEQLVKLAKMENT